MNTIHNYHLVKHEDLNHHGTLYAGRTAEWFVEAGFIAASKLTHPEHIVCLNIHGMLFTKPIALGEILCFESKVVLAGRTSLTKYIEIIRQDEAVLRGFITFIHVDQQGKPIPHGITITPATEQEKALQEEARQYRQK